MPTEKIPSVSIVFYNDKIKSSEIYDKFINSNLPVIGYIQNNRYHIDLKAITEDQIEDLIQGINKVLS